LVFLQFFFVASTQTMDVETTISGMRVLLAANKTSVCNATSKVLRGHGYAVTTCTSQKKIADLLKYQSFDIILAEAGVQASSGASDAVDGLKLLGKEASPPIILAMNTANKSAVDEATRLGAAEVIGLPMAKQKAQLGTLWQHALWQAGGPTSCSSSKASGGTDFDISDLVSADACGGGDELNFDYLLLDPLDCSAYSQYQCTADSASDEVDEWSKLVLSSDLLPSCPPALPLPSMELASGGSVTGVKRPLEDGPAGAGTVPVDGGAESDGSAEGDKKGGNKKLKVEWTRHLHDRFVEAVETLGADKAVPSRILEHMGACASGLTRQNIASHLQKYRSRKNRSRKCGAARKSAPTPPATTQPTMVASFMPVSNAMTVPMQQVSSALQVVPFGGAHQQQHWVPMWAGAVPQGAVLCNHLGQPLIQHQPAHQPTPLAFSSFPVGPSTEAIKSAIRDVLTQPKGKSPLGLVLDASKVVEGLKIPAAA